MSAPSPSTLCWGCRVLATESAYHLCWQLRGLLHAIYLYCENWGFARRWAFRDNFVKWRRTIQQRPRSGPRKKANWERANWLKRDGLREKERRHPEVLTPSQRNKQTRIPLQIAQDRLAIMPESSATAGVGPYSRPSDCSFAFLCQRVEVATERVQHTCAYQLIKNYAQVLADEVRGCCNVENADRRARCVNRAAGRRSPWESKPTRPASSPGDSCTLKVRL